MSSECIFCRIAAGELPADRIYEDEWAVAFKDINPAAPVHAVIVPKSHLANLNEAETANRELFGHLLYVARKAAEKQGVAESGYRLVINTNRDAGQEVFHLHIHLLAGRRMGWPPG